MTDPAAVPDHLDPDAAKALGVSVEARLAFFQTSFWIDYPIAQSHLDDFDSLVVKPRRERMAGYLLVADSNNGKTTLALRFAAKYPSRFDEQLERMQVPVLFYEFPSKPSDTAVLDGLLGLMGIPSRPKDPFHEKLAITVDALRQLNVRVLLLDELQRVLGTRHDHRIEILDMIRYLSNQVPIPLVVLSTPRGVGVLSGLDEMINRVPHLVLPRWHLNPLFQSMLSSFEKFMPLPEASHLGGKAFAPKIYARSEGLIGEVYDLLELALRRALLAGMSKLTPEFVESLPWIKPSERKTMVAAEVRKGS